MLILPLHHPITRRNFPWMTLLLAALNVLAFIVLQGSDGHAQQAAESYYRQSGLHELEAPLYRRYLSEAGNAKRNARLQALAPARQAELLSYWQQTDRQFRQRLAAPESVAWFANHQVYLDWQPLASEFQRLQSRVFTLRHALHAEQPSLSSLLSSLFLHGGFDHLLGNLVFLVILGLLVEAPLGAALYLGLYLLAGLGAGLTWLLFGPGIGSLIGASGAIAGLMGAFCVLWGLRKVRFFYWFLVVFDYVRAPAIALLPLWLGWELLQWLLSDGSPVAYQAHAGGIVAGAALAWIVRQRNWHREQAFEPLHASPAADPLVEALEHLRQLKIEPAQKLLDELARQQPQSFDIALARLRCARYGSNAQIIQDSLRSLIRNTTAVPAQLREQLAALKELHGLGAKLTPDDTLALARRLLDAGELDEAAALAGDADLLAAAPSELPSLWLSLARQLYACQRSDQAIELSDRLCRRFPDAPERAKAEFLQGEWRR